MTDPRTQVGFQVVRNALVTIREPDGDATFQWILAQT